MGARASVTARDKSTKGEAGLRFFPDGSGATVKRRLCQLLGLIFLAAALVLLLACLTLDPMDPSFNRAVDDPVDNLMGLPGAHLADLALRLLGFTAYLVVLVLAGWGWRLLRDGRLKSWFLRLLLLLPLLLLTSAAFSALPDPGYWPQGAGLGGALGDLVAQKLTQQVPLDPNILSLATAFLALLLGIYQLALTGREWRGLGLGLFKGARGAGKGIGEVGKGVGKGVGGMSDLARDRLERTKASDDSDNLIDEGSAPFDRDLDDSDATPPKKTPRFSFGKKRSDKKKQKGDERQEPQFGEVDSEPGQATTRKPSARQDSELTAATGSVEIAAPDASLSVETEDETLVADKPSRPRPSKKALAAAQGRLALGGGDYELPPVSLLAEPPQKAGQTAMDKDALEKNARLLETVLGDYGVRGEIVKVRPGPVVTRYELEPAPGTKTSRVVGLADDIARSLSAMSVRVAVVPGSSVIGIELPNTKRETVYLRELLASDAFDKAKGNLPIVLGKDIGGQPQIVDLAKMPHLLVAGTTGSGKSVGLNAMILSLLYRFPPEKCRFIMIDPKMLELSVYDNIPHLLAPVVTEPKKAVVAIKWAVREMEDRYRAMSRLGVRNIDGYNARVEQALKSGEVLTRRVQTGFDPETGQPVFEEQPFDLDPLPFIVVIVDEMADLMLVAGKEVEAAIQRLAQMARAAGIHIIMATQRPSVDVITGTIKANFPTRISFHVTSKIDSRTILGESGAEHLLGMGDMLHMGHGGRLTRVHGPFCSDEEVEEIVSFLKSQGAPSFVESVTEEEDGGGLTGEAGGSGNEGGSGDALFDQAVEVVAHHRKASTSFIQRQLQIGYNRAARLIEKMEEEGMVSSANHVGKREILLPDRRNEE